ncbi:MAG: T9SS type A sorting domain-containing protein [Bacteroidetes bacterium]|nr:T9SS type A sorting domain-containing protein [Bacteroidota bacterium]
MKKLLLLVNMMLLFAATSYAQVTVSGATGGGNGSYTSLTNATGAFAAINGGTQTGASIIITITQDLTTEPGTIGLNAGAWTSLVIHPAGARTVSGSASGAALISLNGADHVTIDGLNTGGNSLTISNLSTSSAVNTSTIRFMADAVNNTITRCTVSGSSSTPLATDGGTIFLGTGISTGNDSTTISYCNIGPAGAALPSKGIYANGSTGSSAAANSNVTIANCEIYDFFLSGGCAGVYTLAGNSAWSIVDNLIYQTSPRIFTVAGTLNGIYFANSTTGSNINITGNTIGYGSNTATGTLSLTGTGIAAAFQGIYLVAASNTSIASNVCNNLISDISLTSSTGTFYGITNASYKSINTLHIDTNVVKNIGIFTSKGMATGISAGDANIITCNSNTLDNISRNTGGFIYGIQYGSPSTITISGNTIKNLHSASTSSSYNFYGLYSEGNPGVTHIINNSIYNLTSSSASTQTIIGWYANTQAGSSTVVQNNSIYNLSAAGNATIYGMKLYTGSNLEISGNQIYSISGAAGLCGISTGSFNLANIFRNKIYSLSCPSETGWLYGLYINTGSTTTMNVYNNFMGDLNTPAATSPLSLIGAYIGSGIVNFYYNTIYLNATSSGSMFGSAAVYAQAGVSVMLDMRNNVIVNTSVANGGSNTAAYRRTGSTPAGYAATSNNNLFYAGTPGPYNVIMYDGTNAYQTIAAYKTAIGPSCDALSVTENPHWTSISGNDLNYLHIAPSIPTQIESGGAPVAGYSNDYDGDIRNPATPDIGADEFAGTMIDVTAPAISFTALPNSCNNSDRTLQGVIISDISGVPVTGTLVPRIYYKKNSGTWHSQPGVLTSGSATYGTWSFTIVTADMGGVTGNDVVSYFVIAQDVAPTGNIRSNPADGLVAVNVNTVTTPPNAPVSYTVLATLSGSYNVGLNGQYPTLTAAVGAYNNACLGGPVTFILTSAAYSAGEVFPVTIHNNAYASTTNTLTIQPAGGVNVVISGTQAGPLIDFSGADYVIINGLNAGGSSLAISNTNAGSAVNTSTLRFIADATHNTITNCTVSGSACMALATDGGTIFFSTGITTGNDNNTISHCKIGPAGSSLPSKGIYDHGNPGSSYDVNSSITITNCEIYDFFLTGGCTGITILTGQYWNIINNKIYQTAPRTFTSAGAMNGIYYANSMNGTPVNITNNTIGYATSSGTGTLTLTGSGVAGSFKGIYIVQSGGENLQCNLYSNVISDISLTSSTGTFYGIYNGITYTSNVMSFDTNQVKNIHILTTTDTVAGIYAGGGSSVTCNMNVVNNITRNTGGVFFGIRSVAPYTLNFTGNTVSNLTSASTSSVADFFGLYSSGIPVNETVTDNNIFNLTTSSTGAQTIMGFNSPTSTGTKTIQNNNIYGLSGTGGTTIYGIRAGAGTTMEISGNKLYSFSNALLVTGINTISCTTCKIFKNKIYDLSSANSNATVYGLYISGGTTINVYNNLIGDLRATAANSDHPLAGIFINSYTPANIYYNTVFLNAVSSGALFGSSAIYIAESSALDMRNNIFVNTSVPKGAGITATYRREGTSLANYAGTSNNNLFYAGTPGTHNLIMYDGTNAYQTLASYKTAVGPTRDAFSITENPAWVSTSGGDASYLHITVLQPTQIESGGAPVASYTTDYDGDSRNTVKPDIGADEFAGVVMDVTAPVISYSAMANSCSLADRTLSGVMISDVSGVPLTGTLVPRIYYKKNSGTWYSHPGVLTSGSASNGTWSFTIVAADMGGVAGNDVVSYYVIAQDVSTQNNLSSDPAAGLVATSVNSVTTPPSTPNTFTVLATLSGTYTVGTGGHYPTLTEAVNAYNGACLAGPVIFSLTGASYSGSESFPIVIQANTGSSAINTLTIKPATGVNVVVSGTNAGPLVDLNGADHVTFDGLNSGGSSLTISNTNSGTAANTSTLRFIADATHNTITNCTITGSSGMALTTDGGTIFFSNGTVTGNDNNTISNCSIAPAGTSLPSKGIYGKGSTGSPALANSNVTISNCDIYNFFQTTGCAGIYILTGNTGWNIANNKFYQAASRTFTAAGTMNGIYFANASYGNNIQITGNTIGYASNAGAGTLTLTGSGVAGSFQGIYLAAASTADTACNISNNIITDISLTSSTGTFSGICNASIASSNAISINTNTVQNIGILTTNDTVTGICAGGAANLNCNANLVDNITRNTGGIVYGIRYVSPITVTCNGNNISNLASTGASASSDLFGLYSSGTSSTETILNNNIYNITSVSTGAETIVGWYANAQSGASTDARNNNIYNLSAAGGATIYGLNLALGSSFGVTGNTVHSCSGAMNLYGMYIASGANGTISNNEIYNLSSGNTNPTVCGLYNAGASLKIFNNLIGDLRAASANAALPIKGIYNADNFSDIYFNTVYINATSSGSLFGSTAVYSHITPITLRNNILVNTSTPNGAGYTSAYCRDATWLGDYTSNSDNNLFYAGTPGEHNVIMYDGTNAYQTLAAYKAAVEPGRDASSVTENPHWISTSSSDPAYLRIDPSFPTQIESGGIPVAGCTTDFDGDTRNAIRPDIGADEFTGTNIDKVAPVISYTMLNDSCINSSRWLTGVTITDITGVPDTGNLVPRIYYKKNSGTWQYPQPGQLMSGTLTNGTWRFHIVTNALETGDLIYYYVIAQDVASPMNITSNPSANMVATDVTNVTTPPSNPSFYQVLPGLSGTYAVGKNLQYPNLQAAAYAYNNSCLHGPVTFMLMDASYTGDSNIITIHSNPCANATNILTIKPATGNQAVISCEVPNSPVIKIEGAKYVTIDGSNCGYDDRSLTITNTSTTGPTAVSLASSGTGAGASHVIIKNCNISTETCTTTGYGIAVGGVTSGTPGSDNDNVSLINNLITGADIGIYACGNAAVSSNGMDNLTVTNNSVGTSTLNPCIGIQAGNGLNCSISDNYISVQTSSWTPVGISLETGFVSSAITGNNITCVNTTSAGFFGGRGITVGTGLTGSSLTIANNFISGVTGMNNAGFNSSSSMGIGIGMIGYSDNLATTTGGINLYYNTVNMYGSYTAAAACHTTALYAGSGASALDVRDNIFMNSMNNTNVSGTGSKNYSVYSAAANMAFNNLNYNDYYVSGVQGVLGSYLNSDITTLEAWQAATGKDANSKNILPGFISPSDLHMVSATNTPLDNLGTPIAGITVDFDDAPRSLATPDIGADEFTSPAAADMGATTLVSPAAIACYSSAETVTVTIKNYSATLMDFTLTPVTVSVTATGGYSSSIVISTGTLAFNATRNITLPAAINMSADGSYTFNAQTQVAGDALPGNNAMMPVTILVTGMASGTNTVGSGGTYSTLTAAVAAYNSATCLRGPVIFSLTDATYPGETFPIIINANAMANATNTLTIKPAPGVNPVISGSGTSAILKLNGADYVILDGSNNGTNSRNLTIENTSTDTSSVVVWNGSAAPSDGATLNIVKNCILKGSGANNTLAGLFSGSGTMPGNAAEASNSGCVFQNNSCIKSRKGIMVAGTGGQTGNVISQNSIGSETESDYIGSVGMSLSNCSGIEVTQNTIFNLITSSPNPVGMDIRTGVLNSRIDGNVVRSIRYTGTGSYGGKGMNINTGNAESNLVVSNNMISDILGDGWSDLSSDAIVGIRLGATGGAFTTTGGINLYYNTVNLGSGSFSGNAAGTLSAALYLGPATSALDIRDNLFVTNLVNSNAPGAKTYSIYSAAANTAFSPIDYNDYSVSGTQGVLGYLGSERSDLAGIISGFGGNANSRNIAPVFITATDLHLVSDGNFALDGLGTPITGITTDIDDDTRNPATPDMGADEFSVHGGLDMGATALVAPDASGCYNTAETITVAIKNYSVAPIDFSMNPVKVTVTATGGYASDAVLAYGTLAGNTTLEVSMPATINMGTSGDYTFNANTVVTGGDNTPANDAMSAVTRTANALLQASVTISASANPVFTGTAVTFTAVPVNGGTAPAYMWTVNGLNVPGATNSGYTYIPVDGDVITCTLTSNASCTLHIPVISSTVIMSVNTVAISIVLQNLDITGTQCFDAIQTITVAGGGNTFVVQNGGNVTMIAGQNIDYLPGTVVEPGGYMHGFITESGEYCGSKAPSMVATGEDANNITQARPFFKVYPNPTEGVFALEFDGIGFPEKIHVEIYNMTGEKILSTDLSGERIYNLSLSGKPAGIYLLKVVSGHIAKTVRIIRQ